MINIHIAKEALPFTIVLIFLVIITACFSFIFAIIPFVLLAFVLFFFRDPERKIVINPNQLLSPADGVVMAITEYNDDVFFKTRVKKITIFLSVLNVHVNRSPIKGKVIYRSYTEGQFLPAYREEAGLVNERNTIGIENAQLKILVHQIAGILARRIVCWSKTGDQLEQGQRFGLIKFGSCTEVVFPATAAVKVNIHDKVKGGLTVIAEI
jgi:phosphatidylserine decarboxylase